MKLLSLFLTLLIMATFQSAKGQGRLSATASGNNSSSSSSFSSGDTAVTVTASTSGGGSNGGHTQGGGITTPAYPVDFSTVESSLRTHIFQGDVNAAAKDLASPKTISLGAGLTYPGELSFLVEPTFNRNNDPDVVAFKALALSALQTGSSSKLATAVTLSFRPDCTCAVMTAEEADALVLQFTRDFENKERLRQIVNADANTEFGDSNHFRKIFAAGASPVNSFVCSSCWPKKECKKVHWC